MTKLMIRGGRCINGHPYTGEKDARGHNVCLICNSRGKDRFAGIKDLNPAEILGSIWDRRILRYASSHTPEETAAEFKIEIETVRGLLYGRGDNSQFREREPQSTRPQIPDRGDSA